MPAFRSLPRIRLTHTRSAARTWVVVAAAVPAGYKPSEPMLMWEALRQATDEARSCEEACTARRRNAGNTCFSSGAESVALQELERDPTVMVMGEDVGHYGGSYKARTVRSRLLHPYKQPHRPGYVRFVQEVRRVPPP